MWIHMLEHALLHSLEETLKLIPFLFVTYLLMEYLENRAGQETIKMLSRTGKKGPVIGAALGMIPQCGFSAAAANLYAGGVITVGTLVAVFLSTSDEMLPILISGRAGTKEIIAIVLAKGVVGCIFGFLVDYAVRRQNHGHQKGLQIHEICEKDHCHCEEGSILKSALIHCANITVFIFAVLFVIHLLSEVIGMEQLLETASKYPFFSVFVVALLGLIPNCAVSVAITTLYLEGVLSLGSMFAGLLSCAGIGIAVLFKMNPNWKKSVMITGGIYAISVCCGVLLEILF